MAGALFLAVAPAVGITPANSAPVSVQDDSGQTIRLSRPAVRIVSLAPHLTENLYAAGAGNAVVGTVEFSDHPPAASKLPRIGRYDRIDTEALLALKPDLVIAWESGTPRAAMDKLRTLGVPVYVSQTGQIDALANDLERLGQLAGHRREGEAAAGAFRRRLADLRAQWSKQPPVRVFYEIWNAPLMTVGGQQVVSDVLRLCGGENVFGALTALAPTVSVEAVLAARPEAIVAAGMGDARPEWLDDWKKWPQLPAAARGNLFHIHPDLMHRHTPRLLDGAEKLCGQLEQARKRR